jgi:hypothetical protein
MTIYELYSEESNGSDQWVFQLKQTQPSQIQIKKIFKEDIVTDED